MLCTTWHTCLGVDKTFELGRIVVLEKLITAATMKRSQLHKLFENSHD